MRIFTLVKQAIEVIMLLNEDEPTPATSPPWRNPLALAPPAPPPPAPRSVIAAPPPVITIPIAAVMPPEPPALRPADASTPGELAISPPPSQPDNIPARPAPPSSKSNLSQISQQGKGCLPCGSDHYSVSAGLLSEAIRFTRTPEGLSHPEVTNRISQVEDELNAFERVDGSPDKVAKLPPDEKALMDEMLVKSRGFRHKLSDLRAVQDLESVAAEVVEARKDFRGRLFKMQFSKLSPEQKDRVVTKAKEMLAKQQEG